jgi:hypothetical protein
LCSDASSFTIGHASAVASGYLSRGDTGYIQALAAGSECRSGARFAAGDAVDDDAAVE